MNKINKNQVLVLDYGGVLGDHHQDPAEYSLSTLLKVTREDCRKLVSEKSEQGAAFREDRITETEFWDWVHKLAGISNKNRTRDSTLSKLWAETYKINTDVLNTVRSVRKTIPVGILSNIDRARSSYLIDEVGILSEIDIFLPSYKFKAIKPKDKLWQGANLALMKKFGPEVQVIYVDDRDRHVKACKKVGWNSFKFYNNQRFVEDLKERHLLA